MNDMPTISVILSVYNSQNTIAEAIESVLQQTYKDIELNIIDDGSTDATPSILQEFASQDNRIKIITNSENIGLTRSLNKGLDLARGKYIARMDADDISLPERFEKQVNYLENNPAVGIVSANCTMVNHKKEKIIDFHYPTTDIEIRWHLLYHNPFCHPCSMFRADLVKNGNYDPAIKYAQDYEYWSRLLQHTQGHNINEILFIYRRDEQSISKQQSTSQQFYSLQISRNNLNQLMGDDYYSLEEVKKLQQWYNHALTPSIYEDIPLLHKWISTYRYFCRRYNHVSGLSTVKTNFINRMQSYYFNNKTREIHSFPWFWKLFSIAPLTTIKNYIKRILR